MTSTHHMWLDIRGALMNWKDRDFVGVFSDDDGRPMSPREAKAVLMEELAKGHRVLPVGSPCEGFSYQTGCPGHPREKIDAIIGSTPMSDRETKSTPENA